MDPSIHIARGVAPVGGGTSRATGEPSPPIRAVLFDFAYTLFRPVDAEVWLRSAAAASGRALGDADVARLLQELDAAWELPEVIAAQEGRDTSEEAHRRARLAWIAAVEELEPLAEALSEGITATESYEPFADVPRVLAALADRGVPVGIVSDIAWDIRKHFVHHGLDSYIGAYALSYEHGTKKPDPVLFRHACAELGVDPRETLMVGDNPVSDGGAVAAGLRAYVLPAEPGVRERGLDVVLRLVEG